MTTIKGNHVVFNNTPKNNISRKKILPKIIGDSVFYPDEIQNTITTTQTTSIIVGNTISYKQIPVTTTIITKPPQTIRCTYEIPKKVYNEPINPVPIQPVQNNKAIKNIMSKNLLINTTVTDTVEQYRIMMWKLKLNTAQKVNMIVRLLMNQNELRTNKYNLTVIVSNKHTSYTFPVGNDRVYYLNNNNITKNDTFTLGRGITYIKIIGNQTTFARYDIKVSNIVDKPFTPIIMNQSSNKKYALLVGISDYLYIGDLSFCDEDIITWADYLTNLGYEIVILGDKTSSYGKYKLSGFAYESTIREHMHNIASKVTSGDQFVFVNSGHGSGDGKGNSFICCLDNGGSPQGEYTDKELGNDIKVFTNKGVNVIAFFDNCLSGGLLDEINTCDPAKVCATSTCTASGYGFDVNLLNHGAWTYYFLIKTICDAPIKPNNLFDAFYKALANYPYRESNLPQIIGNGKLMF